MASAAVLFWHSLPRSLGATSAIRQQQKGGIQPII